MDYIVQSFTNILANGAGRATIDEIHISIADLPYILHTEITDIHVIGEVRQGEEATFVIEMLPHWSATGQNRKMYREVKLQIPELFAAGPARLSIAAATEYGFNPFGVPYAPSPESLDQLIGQLKDQQFDKGLVLVTLATLVEEEPELLDPSLDVFFEKFFEEFFAGLLGGFLGDGETPPENGETPPENGETPPENGETPPENEGEIIVEEEVVDELPPPPPSIPITGTALVINRFIVTGDTEIEIEVQPAAVDAEAAVE